MNDRNSQILTEILTGGNFNPRGMYNQNVPIPAPANTPLQFPNSFNQQYSQNTTIRKTPQIVQELDEEEDEEITLQTIIKEKPKTKIVREFMKQNLESIKTDDDEIFELEI